MADIIKLITQEPYVTETGDTVFDETARTVFCNVSSVGLKRKMDALTAGLKLAYKFTLSDTAEYKDEEVVEYCGHRYNVVNVFELNNGGVELTTSRY